MTAKIGKAWFAANPRSVVSFHYRMALVSPAARERLTMPRNATVHGNRVVFNPHQSEISLVLKDCTVTPTGELEIRAIRLTGPDSVHFVTYRAVK